MTYTLDTFVKDAQAALKTHEGPAGREQVRALLDDGSPLVRAMAVWAAARLCDHDSFKALAQMHASSETDLDVRAEWARGCGDIAP